MRNLRRSSRARPRKAARFRIENFVSNGRTFQVVIPWLRERVKPGGVYLGVGPEQNFTFISAVGAALAFIVDIRPARVGDDGHAPVGHGCDIKGLSKEP